MHYRSWLLYLHRQECCGFGCGGVISSAGVVGQSSRHAGVVLDKCVVEGLNDKVLVRPTEKMETRHSLSLRFAVSVE